MSSRVESMHTGSSTKAARKRECFFVLFYSDLHSEGASFLDIPLQRACKRAKGVEDFGFFASRVYEPLRMLHTALICNVLQGVKRAREIA